MAKKPQVIVIDGREYVIKPPPKKRLKKPPTYRAVGPVVSSRAGRRQGRPSSGLEALRDHNLSIYGGDSGRVLPVSPPRAERRAAKTLAKHKDLEERGIPVRVKRSRGMLSGGLPQ